MTLVMHMVLMTHRFGPYRETRMEAKTNPMQFSEVTCFLFFPPSWAFHIAKTTVNVLASGPKARTVRFEGSPLGGRRALSLRLIVRPFLCQIFMNEIMPPYAIPESYFTAADDGKVLSKAFQQPGIW